MHKLTKGILFATIIIFVGVASQAALADSHNSGPVAVILADRQAVAGSETGIGSVESVLGLISALKKAQSFAFISADEPTEALGPTLARDSDVRAFKEQVSSRLASSPSGQEVDLVRALSAAYNLLGSARAGLGSSVYLITGGPAPEDVARVADRLTPVVRAFKDSGWPIVGLSLPGASPEVRELLDGVSRDSGGDSFDLSTPDGFKGLANKVLRDQAKGSLAELGKGVLSSGDVLTSTLTIAPGTREATLLFFKESPSGSLRLSNPSGFEASAGDRTESSVLETSHVVIWRLIDPAPGDWRVDVRGVNGAISGWHYAVNRYSIALQSLGTVPLDQTMTLVASVMDEGQRVALDGVKIVARITTPEGKTLLHELNDDGVLGDAVPGDGSFSATMPPLAVEGEYQVDLELSWPQFDHRISTQASFMSRAFPAIELTPIQTEDMRPGERTKVATILVNIQGQPYGISVDELTSALASNADDAGVLEVLPQEMLDQERAWAFDVFFTPRDEGLHTLIFRLNMEYAGRQYTHDSDYMVLSSALAPLPPAPVVVAPAPVPPPVAPQLPPPLLPRVEPSGFPWGLLAVPIAVMAVLGAGVVYLLTRTKPHGYLYNDRDEPVVDFANLKRHPVMRFLFKSRVRGKELGLAGLESVLFKFSGERIGLGSRRLTPTVRVNNQPLIGDTTIHDRTWIGTHGRLYSFFLSPQELQPEPSPGDD